MFTHNCFIRKNSECLRKSLDLIGKRNLCNIHDGILITHSDRHYSLLDCNETIELSQEWDEFVDTLVRLFLYFYGLEQKNSTKVNELAIRSEIDIYTPENTTEVVNILNSSKTMKTLSTKTAAERHPYATNDEVERLQDEAKAEADLTASTVQTGMNENNLQQSLLNE